MTATFFRCQTERQRGSRDHRRKHRCRVLWFSSLEQMLEKGTSNIPEVTLYDYADQQSRGLVEGYYGYPYSVAVKKDLMRFMMRMKMEHLYVWCQVGCLPFADVGSRLSRDVDGTNR